MGDKMRIVKKKRIMFLIRSFHYGGVGKVLFDLVRLIDKEKYDVTIISISNQGIYKEMLPEEIKFKYILNKENGIKSRIFNFLMYRFPGKIFYKIFIPNRYDVEIAFMENYPTKVISCSGNKKSKKLAWVHTDLIKNNFSDSIYDTFNEHIEAYKKFDNIICVSDSAREKFIKKFGFKGNVIKINNPIMIEEIYNKSKEIGFNDKVEGIRILTVGRLSEAKGQDMIVNVARLLKEDGFKFKWYLIGDGDLREKIDNEIKKQGLMENIILLGAKENPYPFFKECDLYVQTSRFEGYCMTLREAIIFKKPIITTDFESASEQIKDGENGIITKMNVESIYDGIKKVLINENLKNDLKNNLKNNYVNADDIMRDIYALIK